MKRSRWVKWINLLLGRWRNLTTLCQLKYVNAGFLFHTGHRRWSTGGISHVCLSLPLIPPHPYVYSSPDFLLSSLHNYYIHWCINYGSYRNMGVHKLLRQSRPYFFKYEDNIAVTIFCLQGLLSFFWMLVCSLLLMLMRSLIFLTNYRRVRFPAQCPCSCTSASKCVT